MRYLPQPVIWHHEKLIANISIYGEGPNTFLIKTEREQGR